MKELTVLALITGLYLAKTKYSKAHLWHIIYI
jgi:hypothetical protein